ncbi:MAG: hypothetical protein FVQ85_04425 [Planctomycetes bacterium]|nr:hypothetical protein [Planctomycetota bacterium]
MAKKKSVKGTWTKAEVTLLKKMFPNNVTTKVAAKLGRPVDNVKKKAYKMGLKKTKKHLKTLGLA